MSNFTLTTLMLAAAIGLAVATTPVSAEETYYRWKDERGNTQHSDRPPPKGVDYEVVSTDSHELRKVSGDKGAVPLQTTPTPSNNFETSPKSATGINKSPELCQRARQNLSTLQDSERIRMRDNKGEYRYLTEEEKEEQVASAQSMIRKHCN